MANNKASKVILLVYLLQVAPLLDLRVVVDESWLGIPAAELVQHGTMRLSVSDDAESIRWSRPPLLQYILALAFEVGGIRIKTGRWAMILLGMSTVAITFFLGRRVTNPPTAGLAAFLLSTDNLFFLSSRTIRYEALVCLLSTGAVLSALFGRVSAKRGAWIASAVFAGLGLVSHPSAFPAMLFTFYLLATEWRRKRIPIRWFCGLLLLMSLPVISYILLEVVPHFNTFSGMAGSRIGQLVSVSALLSLVHEEMAERWAGFLLFPVRLPQFLAFVGAIGLIIFGRRMSWHPEESKSFPALRPLVGFVVLFLVYLTFLPTDKTVRYFAVIAPVYSLLISGAIMYLSSSTALLQKRKLLETITWSGVIALLAYQGLLNLAYLYKYRGSSYGAVITEIRKAIHPHDVLYGTMNFALAFHEQPYWAWEVANPDSAIEHHKADVFLMNDRDLVSDEGGPDKAWREKRRRSMERICQGQGKLIGKIEGGFYGTILIYRIANDGRAP